MWESYPTANSRSILTMVQIPKECTGTFHESKFKLNSSFGLFGLVKKHTVNTPMQHDFFYKGVDQSLEGEGWQYLKGVDDK